MRPSHSRDFLTKVKVYSDSPADMAKLWVSKGAAFLHLVDLDGALAGRSVNEKAIRAVVKAVDVPVQIGGGIRSLEAAKIMLDLGVSRVIIGTRARGSRSLQGGW